MGGMRWRRGGRGGLGWGWRVAGRVRAAGSVRSRRGIPAASHCFAVAVPAIGRPHMPSARAGGWKARALS
jgi:hypothetical protein